MSDFCRICALETFNTRWFLGWVDFFVSLEAKFDDVFLMLPVGVLVLPLACGAATTFFPWDWWCRPRLRNWLLVFELRPSGCEPIAVDADALNYQLTSSLMRARRALESLKPWIFETSACDTFLSPMAILRFTCSSYSLNIWVRESSAWFCAKF